MDVDLLFYLPFTKAFSEQNAEDFLTTISKKLNFKKLILGYDARIGRGREGDKNKILELSRKMQFEAQHLEPLIVEEKPASSSAIRQAIQKGDLKTAETFLGRPYSILGLVTQGKQLGKKLGFPTANLDVSDLCLPPFGVYAVEAEVEGKRCSAIANIGIAPTIRADGNPLLEVYLFEEDADLYGKELEVIFKKFLRPEMKFKNEEELRLQIAKDIKKAKSSDY
jgi:riboflavin kinase/FMN adenylyltransferase